MLQLVHQTLGEFLRIQAGRFHDRDALVSDSAGYTYSQLLSISGDLAEHLLGAGICRGTHVGVWSNDSPDMVCAMFALWRIGAVAVPICTSYGLAELYSCISAGDVEYMLIDSGYRGQSFSELCRQLEKPLQSRIFALDHVTDSEYIHVHELPAVGEKELETAEKQVRVTDTDTILFTSGSTGGSKPVETSHFSRVNTMIAQARALDADENDRFCTVLPMYHCFSLTAVVLAAIAAGAGVYFPPSRRTQDILNCIEKWRCTVLTAVPTLFSALLRRQKEMRADVSSLRTGMIGGSTYTQDFFEEICTAMDYTLLPSLGQTEATAGISSGSVHDSLKDRSTTLGTAFPGVELMIVTGNGLTQGESNPGEICLRGFNVMKGYYRQPQATAGVIDQEGWLHTGDMGWTDSFGKLHYAGRIKEIIIRGGENIFPGEIENVILSDARIAECKVIGVPDAHYIEEVCACVVPETGATVSMDDIRKLVADRLSYFKVPRYVRIMDSLPKKPTGKIDAAGLKTEAEQLLCRN